MTPWCAYGARARVPTLTLREDLVLAVRSGGSLSEVLREHGISRTTYYRWRSIARGEIVVWWDGCVVDERMRSACSDLVIAVTHARLERDQAELDHLLACVSLGSHVPLVVSP